MKLIFEKSRPGRGSSYLPPCDVPIRQDMPEALKRTEAPELPEVSEIDLVRHHAALLDRVYGVNRGFYPLGSCTMKYNPRINEEIAGLPGFCGIHPLQPEHTVQGCLEVLETAEKLLCEITGMDRMTFQPAAGAQGEFTGLLLIRAYHQARGDVRRTKIIVPDSAHGTNPASAAMAGFTVVSIPSGADGCVDLDQLRAAADDETAGLMLTNPNTLGLFDRNILEITKIIHDAGGLAYYDGANLNAVIGIARPGDMGFDVMHLNLHKTFSTPHGGGGPGSGPVGCRETLAKYLPEPAVERDENSGALRLRKGDPASIGQMKSFYGNFLVVVRALAYVLTLGREGVPEVSRNAVLNANYLLKKLESVYKPACSEPCMHEFVLTIDDIKKETGVSALDFAKFIIDQGIHPPTMYFPLIVHEALMVEPTETESIDTLDEAAEIFMKCYMTAYEDPEAMKKAPATTPVGRLDEVSAARFPKLKF